VTERRTVLIASGDRLFAQAAGRFLEGHRWRVVATAYDGLQALAGMTRYRPTAVLALGELPRLTPSALAGQIRRRWPHVPVVLLGAGEGPDAMALPADADAETIMAGLATQPPGQPEVAPVERPDSVALLRSLTSRERLVLKFAAEGVPMREIARRLGLSQHTVRTHMQNLYAKLGAHSRLDVVRFAAQHGLVAGEAEEAAP
jgi:DNA-binding NarL/FixJ family response regulator